MDGFESLESAILLLPLPPPRVKLIDALHRPAAPPARDHSKQSALFRLDGMGLLVIDVTTLIVP